MKYVVIEIQDNGTISTLSNAYTDRNSAEAKYHTVLTAAAQSSIALHAAVLLTGEGTYIKSECFRHGNEE